MSLEIERKFLVTSEQYKTAPKRVYIQQGYLKRSPHCVIRIRLSDADKAMLTIKGLQSTQSRLEYEYALPYPEAEEILKRFSDRPIIKKYRYYLPYGGFTWEIDEFLADNKGLVVAEIELEYENQEFPRPEWIGQEVTADERYYNYQLVENPYQTWPDQLA